MHRKSFNRWNRRQVVIGLGAGSAGSLLGACATWPSQSAHFRHGVASGDPSHDRVILWTRITAAYSGPVDVEWELAEKPDFAVSTASGVTRTDAGRDYTVKVDARELRAGYQYYYRFRFGGSWSAIGSTKTLPKGSVDSVSMAVVSCSNHPAGYFNVYDAIARDPDIDVVLHLGDYIYEYGMGGYNTSAAEKLRRVSEPAHEIVSLSDYRMRYAQYRTDAGLQAMHARMPMIAIWDDHEFANNAWQQGAENHGDDEGDWSQRRRDAEKAFREWMPIRDNHSRTSIYRNFDFGDLASLTMLDTRIAGRDPAPELDLSEDSGELRQRILHDPAREMLGRAQSNWLRKQLIKSSSSGKPWQILGQQVITGRIMAPDLSGVVTADALQTMSPGIRQIFDAVGVLHQLGLPLNLDAWDGYPAARKRLFAELRHYANNAVILSGDSHSANAFDLLDAQRRQVGVEFAVTSVTSSGFGYYLPSVAPAQLHERFTRDNRDHRYINVFGNGYSVLHLDRKAAVCRWHSVSTVLNKQYTVALDHEMCVRATQEVGTGPLELV